MTLGSFQTPDSMTLEDMDYNLIDWYREQLISRKDRLLPITRTIVADAFFSKETFVRPLVKEEFNERTQKESAILSHSIVWLHSVVPSFFSYFAKCPLPCTRH